MLVDLLCRIWNIPFFSFLLKTRMSLPLNFGSFSSDSFISCNRFIYSGFSFFRFVYTWAEKEKRKKWNRNRNERERFKGNIKINLWALVSTFFAFSVVSEFTVSVGHFQIFIQLAKDRPMHSFVFKHFSFSLFDFKPFHLLSVQLLFSLFFMYSLVFFLLLRIDLNFFKSDFVSLPFSLCLLLCSEPFRFLFMQITHWYVPEIVDW